ncbi:MAG TPA: serine--tRNA ligase [Acidobacteriota bacterium]|jgi:seryl-tRNA synthetase|nr:serine--tRNA ligase [Acidobacteriota bacterium]
MLDRVFVRENIEFVQNGLRRKGFEFNGEEFLRLDAEERRLRTEVESLRALRNRTSEEIGRMKQQGVDVAEKTREMKEVGQRIKVLEDQIRRLEQEILEFLATVPNLPHPSVPDGQDSDANRVERIIGQPRRFDFPILDHVDLGTRLNILDMERAAKIAGARFSVYLGAGALLERALANFMLDVHTREHGYKEVLPPFLNNSRSFFGTGNLPKFEADLFKIQGTDYYLVPTAEVPVTNLHAGEILEEEALPLYYTAYTPCFRSEAGSYGKDVRGLIRQHQFNKVELVKFTTPESSYEELEKLTVNAEEILKRLELPYRVVTLCTGDMSFSSAKTYDLEVWIPSQGAYREISSCSNFEDFQARRAGIRYHPSGSKRTRFVHTLNGSGLAVGRTWVAVVENYQQADGSVVIPEVLRSYMHGLSEIRLDDQVQS